MAKVGINKKADYEGWTNWETWNVALLIDNEERTSDLARQMAKNALTRRNRGQLNLDELAKQYARAFSRQERQVKKYHEDMAADARDERGQYESQQLQGKPELTQEEVAAMSSEDRVKHVGDSLQGIFFDMGGTSDWEKPMEPVNWKEIATKFLDDEQTESEYQQEKSGETPEVDPFSDADKAELKAMGVTGSKKAMITSDTQLETLQPVPTGEAPKDDLTVNSHPANENGDGAPVLDGELHHTERPNVNAMREAIETQGEMEVGKPVAETQAEVKAEAGKEVTVEKGSGTQIIINIAGKNKTMNFSNEATAAAFIKGASAKFGKKFKVLSFFDKKVKLTPEEDKVFTELYGREMGNAGSEYMGEVNAQIDERGRQSRVWEEMVKRFPRLRGYVGAKAASVRIVLKSGDHISWHLHQFSNESRYGTVIDVLPENPEGLVIFDAKQEDLGGNSKGDVWGYMGLIWEINGQRVKPINPEAAEFEVVQSNSPQQDANNNAPITSGINDINGAGPAFKGAAYGNTEGGFQSVEQAETYNRMSLGDKGKVHVHGGGGALKGATVKTAKNCTICGKPVVLSPSAIERAKRHGGAPSDYTNLFDAHADCQLAKRKQDTSELIKKHYPSFDSKTATGWQLLNDTACPQCQNVGKLYQYGHPDREYFYCTNCHKDWSSKKASDSLDKAENLEHLTQQDEAAQDKKYAIYTGPTIVKQVAQKLAEAGFLVSNIGTERVYVITDQGVDSILALLGSTWKNRDIQEVPRRKHDDTAFQKTMEKAAAALPPDEYKACSLLAKNTGVSYGEAVEAFLKFPDKPLNERYEWARYTILENEAAMAKSAGFNYFFPGQVLENFYPEIQHELVEYPNATNAPMPAEMTGDAFEVEPGQLEDAIDGAFTGLAVVGYVSTSPAGGMGIGRDGKSQVLEGAPLRKENDIRGPMFTDEFYANYEAIPGSALAVVSSKVAAAEEKQQFTLFLKKVMGEVAATFIAAFKCTSRMPLNKVPGVGEIQLAQVEQPVNSAFNVVNTGSRVKYLMEKLTDSQLQDAINDAYAQGAIWHEGKEGGYVYEIFVRAESIDTESMILKYCFVTGTKEAENE